MARKPRVKKPAKERSPRQRRRGPSALAVVVFLLLAGAAALAAWLTYTYQPQQQNEPEIDTARAVLALDLSKEGSGRQAPPETAAKAANGGSKDKSPPPQPETAAAKTKQAAPAPKPSPPPRKTAEAPAPAPKVEDATPPARTTDAAGPKPSVAAVKPTPQPQSPPPQRQAKPSSPLGTFTPSGGLRPAPDPALIKPTDDGPLPIVAADGRTPLQVYARPYKATGRPRIAIVVGSLGLSRSTTLAAVQQLPGGVTLAFAPYGRNLQDYVNQARAAGHEVLLQVPMEPMDYPTNDPGPHTLLTSLTINRNIKRLDWLLGRFTGYVGVVNYMGGRFTAAESHLLPILEAMHSRGLMFLDAKASSSSVAETIAGRIGLYVAANDRVIDEVASRAAIDARLLELERLAQAAGGAIGIGFPYPVTIERLAQWTRAMGDRGFDLVPISALTDHRSPDQ